MYWLKIRDIHTKMLIETGVEKDDSIGNPLAVQWLGLCVSPAEDTGWVSGQRAKISQKTYVLLYVHRIFLKDTQEPLIYFPLWRWNDSLLYNLHDY